MLNYIGPNNGQGIQIYYDGVEVDSDTVQDVQSCSAGDGRIVVGRQFTDRDRDYASVMVDELLFFNQTLTAEEISTLATSA